MPKVEGLSFKDDDDVGKIKRGLGWPVGQTLSTISTVFMVLYSLYDFYIYNFHVYIIG